MMNESSYAPEDKLLWAIFGRQVSTSKETCLKLPIGGRGRVIDVSWIDRDSGPKAMELGCGSFVEMALSFYLFFGIIQNSIPSPISVFFVLRPVTLPQPGLGRIAEQVQVLVA